MMTGGYPIFGNLHMENMDMNEITYMDMQYMEYMEYMEYIYIYMEDIYWIYGYNPW